MNRRLLFLFFALFLFTLINVFKFEVLHADEIISTANPVSTPSEVQQTKEQEVEEEKTPEPKVSESHAIVPNSTKDFVKLFIGITSSYRDDAPGLRSAVRRSWINVKHSWIDSQEVKFFLGEPTNGSAEDYLSEDDRINNDVVILPFEDTYQNLATKTVLMCKWIYDNFDFNYFLKADDDVYIRMEKIIPVLQATSPRQIYAGNVNKNYIPARGGKWGVSKQEFPATRGPKWINGFYYIMSHDVVFEMAVRVGQPKWPRLHLEDINTAILMSELNIPPIQIGKIAHQDRLRCNETLTVLHYCKAADLLHYYDNYVENKPKFCE